MVVKPAPHQKWPSVTDGGLIVGMEADRVRLIQLKNTGTQGLKNTRIMRMSKNNSGIQEHENIRTQCSHAFFLVFFLMAMITIHLTAFSGSFWQSENAIALAAPAVQNYSSDAEHDTFSSPSSNSGRGNGTASAEILTTEYTEGHGKMSDQTLVMCVVMLAASCGMIPVIYIHTVGTFKVYKQARWLITELKASINEAARLQKLLTTEGTDKC